MRLTPRFDPGSHGLGPWSLPPDLDAAGALAAVYGWLATQAAPAKPLIQHLDGPTRAKVLAALAGLVILGFALMLLAWLGARATRRYANRPSPRSRLSGGADRWLKPPSEGCETGDAEDRE